MATNGTRKLFINVAVRELKHSMEFFTKLGFEFNTKFTDDKAACMIVNEDAYVMLLTEPFFKTFTRRDIAIRAPTPKAYSPGLAAAAPRSTNW